MAKLSVDTLVAEYGMSREKAEALFERAQEASSPVGFKISEKGAVSIYGLGGRWPVTLYADQAERLLEAAPRLRKFIDENHSKLSRKL